MQVTVVTLVVTPDQAERLTLASTEGKIQLALRNPLDLESPETAGVRPGMLMGTVQQRPAPVARRGVAGSHVRAGATHSRRQPSKSSAATSGSTSPSDRS